MKCDAQLPLHPTKLCAHLNPQLFVKRGQGLVEQEHTRLGDGGARKRDPLLLAA